MRRPDHKMWWSKDALNGDQQKKDILIIHVYASTIHRNIYVFIQYWAVMFRMYVNSLINLIRSPSLPLPPIPPFSFLSFPLSYPPPKLLSESPFPLFFLRVSCRLSLVWQYATKLSYTMHCQKTEVDFYLSLCRGDPSSRPEGHERYR